MRAAACALGLLLGAAGAQAHPPAASADGVRVGVFRLTYYYVAEERGAGPWPLYASACDRVLARTSETFHLELSREGTGRLADGRLLNFAERCGCARAGFQGGRICYEELDPHRFPWGKGARHGEGFWPLEPLRSVAVDAGVVPLGVSVYIPQWRGKRGPDGTILDGCFRAEDTGRLIRGRRLDLFAGRPAWATWLQRRYRLARVTVYRDAKRCRAVLRAAAPRVD